MPELLLELFSEEIPARMQARAAADLERAVNDRLFAAGYRPEGVKAFSGPRRLALVAVGLPARQPDRKEEKKGPRVGAPAPAIEGFLKSAGLASIAQAEVREDKKGAYYVATIDEKGRDTAAVIGGFLPEIVRTFPWPKSMRWGDGELRWVRPLKRILCAFDGEIVPFSIDGVAASDATEGHRVMGRGEIRVRTFEKYAAALNAAYVEFDAARRAEIILEEAKTLCQAQGLELVENKALLAEVAGLVEWPVVRMGAFDQKFLDVPEEAISATMSANQKYFSVRDPKTGRLANRFVFVANLEAKDGGAASRAGYERVLTARLSDAWFLCRQDLKTRLADRVPALDDITYFEELGSVGRKVQCVIELARDIAPLTGADPQKAEDAARLAKADLVSGMVREFPELQGNMGRYFAQAEGLDAEIADAIRDHYRPLGQDDELPTAPVSVAVALADRLITLGGFWCIDERPTGSADPFALRRAALGVIKILLANGVRWRFLKPDSIELLSSFGTSVREIRSNESNLPHTERSDRNDRRDVVSLLAFFHDRLKVYLRDQGRRHDRIDAVLMTPEGEPEDDLVLIVRKLEALEAFLATEDGANLAAAYKRAANILKAEEKKGPVPRPGDLAPTAFALAEEKALHAALAAAEEKAIAAVKAEDFKAAMAALSTLRTPLDAFFDKVTVNAEDPVLRANRLALLQRLRAATAAVADLSKLEG